jgi:hypothetical protein
MPALLLALAGALPDGTRAAPACLQGAQVHLWAAPRAPVPGDRLDVVAVATDEDVSRLVVVDPAGRERSLPAVRSGGPPWGLHATLSRPLSGTYRIEARRRGETAACAEVRVGGRAPAPATHDWDLATEALYAVWVEHLFDAPPDRPLRFPSLEPVLRNPERNFLHDYFGAGEDRRLPAEPDCADLPYFLRAYFGWKLGLPVAYRPCDRGGRSRPPRCGEARVEDVFTRSGASAAVFREVSRRIVNTVHSGSARTELGDAATDFYPLGLRRSALWPGTVYADPYGHVLVLVKWVPQSPGRSGLLLAVDAQPDNTVTRKRFWEGTFLFAQGPTAGAGFKAHRPVVPVGTKGRLRPLGQARLEGGSGPRRYSAEQAHLTPEDFYARMELLINPSGLDPEAAYSAALEALVEQLQTRVAAVDRGEAHIRAHPDTLVPMPSGPAIFETTGPWEDYSTPSRDMRLLIAMKVLEGLPRRIRRHPELYALGRERAAAAAARVERLHRGTLGERFISYTRSDGSPWQLSLAEIYARRPGLEMGYNPNDCVERRWGASPGTREYTTCRRQAPADQHARMEEYRPWFRETRRPPR